MAAESFDEIVNYIEENWFENSAKSFLTCPVNLNSQILAL